MLEYVSVKYICFLLFQFIFIIVFVLQVIVFCEYLEVGNVNFDKKNVIELGAGFGIVGIVLILFGKSCLYKCINIISLLIQYKYKLYEKFDN